MNGGEALVSPWLVAMKQVALFAFLAMFAGVLLLAGLGRGERFREAARLPLDDEPPHGNRDGRPERSEP